MPTALRLTAPPIPHVRIALIGLGARGLKTLNRYSFISGAEIRYIADINAAAVDEANSILRATGRPEAVALVGAEAWREACEKNDVDLIYICTEWQHHTPMALYAMERGRHVAVEVPAATTIDECFALVRTSERTRRHLFMTENCCYDLFTLETAELIRQGGIGTVTHLEGAYIHNLTVPSRRGQMTDTRLNWMERSCARHGGNPYPTHAVGPIAHLLDIHRSDRFETLVSMTAKGVERDGQHLGRINNTLLKTKKGVTVLLQLDVTTPRPYNRLQTVCATGGFLQKYPLPTVQIGHTPTLVGEEAEKMMDTYAISPAALCWKEGHRMGVPNEMNYAMDARLIHCLRHGLPLDIDVYDAAEWSCIADLSRQSAEAGGIPVPFPDFLPKA